MIKRISVKKIDQKQWRDLIWFRCRWPDAGQICLPKPGQFFQIVTEREDVFLPRPISVFYADTKGVEFLVRIRGRGTSAIASAENLFLIGPLGNWFDTPSPGTKVALMAGGVGLAPLNFLSRICLDQKRDFIVVWAVKEGKQAEGVLSSLISYPVEIFSEDGSLGLKGDGYTAVDYVFSLDIDRLYMCGPFPMIEMAVRKLCDRKGMDGQFSLEANMACGWGACKGCLTEFMGQKIYVCKDGPVVKVSSDGKLLG